MDFHYASHGAGLEGIVATDSRLCFIDGDAGLLSYQGFRIETLAEHATFEEVIFLLWHGLLPKQSELDELKAALVANRAIPAEVEAFLKSAPKGAPMHVLRTAVSMLALSDPDANNVQAGPAAQKAVRLMAQTATIVTSFDRLRKGQPVVAGDPKLSFAANFLYTLTGKVPDEVMTRAFDVARPVNGVATITRRSSGHCHRSACGSLSSLSTTDVMPPNSAAAALSACPSSVVAVANLLRSRARGGTTRMASPR